MDAGVRAGQTRHPGRPPAVLDDEPQLGRVAAAEPGGCAQRREVGGGSADSVRGDDAAGYGISVGAGGGFEAVGRVAIRRETVGRGSLRIGEKGNQPRMNTDSHG
jgi:hypothetical protein